MAIWFEIGAKHDLSVVLWNLGMGSLDRGRERFRLKMNGSEVSSESEQELKWQFFGVGYKKQGAGNAFRGGR